MDKYQTRYIKHQEKKKLMLQQLMQDRHSERIFGEGEITAEQEQAILDAIKLCPSSCNRKPLSVLIVNERDDKALLGGLLVGGVGWVHRAPKVMLLFADWDAYKEKLDYMPYLDMGVAIQQIYLIVEAIGLKGCYINPNIREQNVKYFRDHFKIADNLIYGGAFAIGNKQ